MYPGLEIESVRIGSSLVLVWNRIPVLQHRVIVAFFERRLRCFPNDWRLTTAAYVQGCCGTLSQVCFEITQASYFVGDDLLVERWDRILLWD